jgi:hypothetical protein
MILKHRRPAGWRYAGVCQGFQSACALPDKPVGLASPTVGMHYHLPRLDAGPTAHPRPGLHARSVPAARREAP